MMERVRCVVALILLIGQAHADSKLDEAKTHFQAGEALYKLGHYEEAIREFNAGYELAPRPAFLINLGQAQRKAHHPREALDLFEKYLNAVGAHDKRRPEVELMASELRSELAQAPPPEPSPEPPPPAPSPVPVVTPPVAPVVVQARPSFARRHWWIFPVAAAVVGVAVGVGVYYGTRGNQFDCGGAIGCIDTTR
jgi:hypothetical protein